MKSGIYQIENQSNGKIYVGSSTNIPVRWQLHKSELRRHKHSNLFLQSDWNQYGEACFTFSVLLYCSKKEMLKEEERIIRTILLTDRNQIYNILTSVGNSCYGYSHSVEAKQKMQGNVNGRGGLGVCRTEGTKQKMSRSHLGLSSGMKGRKHSAETKAKMSEAKVGKPSNRKGVVLSEEVKLKMVLGRRRTYLEKLKIK